MNNVVKMREELDDFLSKPYPNIDGKSIYIWGGGSTARISIEGMRRHGVINRIIAFVDNNKEKWGEFIQGIPIIGPDELKKDTRAFVFINTFQERSNREIEAQLNEIGIECCILDRYFLSYNKDRVLKVFDLLDVDSKELYFNLTQNRFYGTFRNVIKSSNQYFPFSPFCDVDSNEVIIDLGAYIGDTLLEYIKIRGDQFKHYIAFEPDPFNYAILSECTSSISTNYNINRNKFSLYTNAVGEKTQKTRILIDNKGNGISSILTETNSDNSMECEIVSIDEFVNEKIDFIKADIESFEYKMIVGAKKTIRKYKPKLSICIYHNVWDWFDIPLLINSILPEYQMSIRHHADNLTETVLYAWL